MHEAAAIPSWVLLAYLISGVCFILALRGLSSPASSQRGNLTGMLGMAIAVVTTLVVHPPGEMIRTGMDTREFRFSGRELAEILIAIGVGATVGLTIARKIQMTAMPQLVAAFHSLVGMAAVLVGTAAFLNPEAFDIVQFAPNRRGGPGALPVELIINPVSRIEMILGVAIGAITI